MAAPKHDWEQIYEQESPVLFGYLCKRVDEDMAADILQESFVRLMNMIERDKRIDNPRAYLFQVARHLLYGSSKARAKQTDLEAVPEPMAAAATNPESELTMKEIGAQLEKSKADLSEQELEVFEFRWEQGLSTADISAIIGKSDRHVRRILEKIVQKFTQQFRAAGWEIEQVLSE